MMAIYGFDDSADSSMDNAIERAFRKIVVEQFHYTPRADVGSLRAGDRFDLGGVSLEVIHTPGHTRGHCCFLMEWIDSGATRRLLYLGDIDLSSFGPYYGDAWSDLADFEHSLARVREIEADWYATFHHIGVVSGREAFLERLDRYTGVIARREERLLEFLAEPHDLADVVAHRFVYRPGDAVGFADPVERRSMGQHIERLLEAGRLRALPAGRFVRC
jgi:glyoxylase-like metal-dependent hydrolase (beta-lactamase superfamily II)